MRSVVQRISQARVSIAGKSVGQTQEGLAVFLGVERGDTEREAAYMAAKILNLRIFADSENKMNRSIKEIGGQILSISQFTLTSCIGKGRRPDFGNAEEPGRAKVLYEKFNELLAREVSVAAGVFGAMMDIELVNTGPVTFIIEKKFAAANGGEM